MPGHKSALVEGESGSRGWRAPFSNKILSSKEFL